MEIIKGKIKSAQKVVLYGPEGIGKSTFAANFPEPLFLDTEGSTKHLDVARLPKPSSWSMLLEEVQYIKKNPALCRSLVIDTADWAEQLCISHICDNANKKGIEDFGYGKGYVYLEEEFARLLHLLEDVIDLGIHVVFTAHAAMRKFEQPDEAGAYDRWELKLAKKTAPLLKEWADLVLFANYKTYVLNMDGQGAEKGKNKATGGKRVMYTTHHPCWDAKNRHDLPSEMDFQYDLIAHCFSSASEAVRKPPQKEVQEISRENREDQALITEKPKSEVGTSPAELEQGQPVADHLKPLFDLLKEQGATIEEVKMACARKGYYPLDTPIEHYEPGFVRGVLIGAWPKVRDEILEIRLERGA